MSKSRLEKFLYALYSLDSSDLPTPLSRIEELYKCLVTGDEAPTFEPLSRVEKYLMAILGVYNVDSLPNPLSRVEVLLYKLATGDDNLDDVKSFLSEHEELLADIIRNGGVGGNIDIEYVLYTLSTEFNTLYNTAKKPVKSAILKGQTLVNNLKETTLPEQYKGVGNIDIPIIIKINQGETYYAYVDIEVPSGTTRNLIGFLGGGAWQSASTPLKSGINKVELIAKSDLTEALRIQADNGTILRSVVLVKENVEFINQFWGMKSVQMPVLSTVGKNLSPINDYETTVWEYMKGYQGFNKVLAKNILIDENKEYCLSFTKECEDGLPTNLCDLKVHFSSILASSNIDNHNSIYAHCQNNKGKKYAHITMPNIGQGNEYVGKRVTLTNIQLEEGSVATSYEPHKTNILTVNEEVELRGIGDVKDELDLITGELTQRINEVVLDGSEIRHTNNETYMTETSTAVLTAPITNFIIQQPIMCNDLPSYMASEGIWNVKANILSGVSLVSAMWGFCIRLPHTLTGVTTNDSADTIKQKFKAYLQSNPITVQYHLATESVKTVDLSVVNQDGNDAKLSTFDDLTHVTLSSEELIPEAELEVATKNEEDLEDSVVYAVHTLSEGYNTLYNTAEKPVKSAILKGNTLVNMVTLDTTKEYVLEQDGSSIKHVRFNLIDGFENDIYTIMLEMSNVNIVNPYKVWVVYIYAESKMDNTADNTTIKSFIKNGRVSFTYTPSRRLKTKNWFDIRLHTDSGVGSTITIKNVVVLKGDHTQEDIPYFEGMQSVKMPVLTTTGKNLMPVSTVRLEGITKNSGEHPQNLICANIPVVEGKTYKISEVATNSTNITKPVLYRFEHSEPTMAKNHQELYKQIGRDSNKYTFKVPQGIHYVSYTFGNQVYTNDGTPAWLQFDNIQLEESSTTTEYEPYKSNILTVNEEVELRGIGDVRDELDLLTGEVVENVGEVDIVSKSLSLNGTPSTFTIARFYDKEIATSTSWMCNKCNIKRYYTGCISDDDEGIFVALDGDIYIKILSSKLTSQTVDGIKELGLKIQYKLLEKVVKTVDLSVVNQDGNDTELSTFNDITHVTLSSEGLIPEAELEVAEKVTEVAASMLTISREQEVINATTNEQSENVDATMIATTEIYEDLL